jgi:hypothetical protein
MAITRIGNPALADVREPNFRNIIINGGMDLAQRGTSFAAANDDDYTLDRFKYDISGTDVYQFTISQDTDVPTGQGFAKSMKFDCTTADASLDADNYAIIHTRIEGQNLQYLKKGTSNAESTTISFWVKSNKTGTYIVELQDSDNNRVICKSYTVSSSSTWEKKTITFAGDTTGAFDNDNAASLRVNFWLLSGTAFTSGTLATSWESRTNANRAVGQVNLGDNTSNEWYVTGIQLEAGSVASDFEFLPVDVNLQRCLRYYHLIDDGDNTSGIGVATSYTVTTAYLIASLNPEMRTTPSIDQVSGTSYYNYLNEATGKTFNSFSLSATNSTNKFVRINNAENITITAGTSGWFKTNDTSAYIAFDAEL